MARKQAKSFRLSDAARELLAEMAETLAISQSAVLELAIREKAERHQIPPERRTPKSERHKTASNT